MNDWNSRTSCQRQNGIWKGNRGCLENVLEYFFIEPGKLSSIHLLIHHVFVDLTHSEPSYVLGMVLGTQDISVKNVTGTVFSSL